MNEQNKHQALVKKFERAYPHLLRMDLGEFEQKFMKHLDIDCQAALNIGEGHTKNFHVQQTDQQLITRQVKDNMEAVTCFTDKEALEMCLLESLYYQSRGYAKWLLSSPEQFSSFDEYNTYAFSLDLEEVIGTGFKGTERYDVTGVCVVLNRDYSGSSLFGSYLLTAYPDIQIGTPSENQLSPEDYLNLDYLSEFERLQQYVSSKYPDFRCVIKTTKETGMDYIRITKDLSPDEKIVAFFSPNEPLRIKHYDLDDSERETLSSLAGKVDLSIIDVFSDVEHQVRQFFPLEEYKLVREHSHRRDHNGPGLV